MKMTFRWYGEGFDPIPLQYIKQIPEMTGIMGTLSGKQAGEVWEDQEIKDMIAPVHAAGLECEVIESVNVHEDIKMGLATRDEYIANYNTTLENLANNGVKVVVYNFMPVFDWLRTELAHVTDDGSNCLYYDHAEVEGMSPRDIVERTAKDSGGLTLPGWEPERLERLDEVMALYQDIDHEAMRANYRYFLEGIIPTAEKVGIKMACHPDDPAWDLFGLPRIHRNRDDMDKIASSTIRDTTVSASAPVRSAPTQITMCQRSSASLANVACSTLLTSATSSTWVKRSSMKLPTHPPPATWICTPSWKLSTIPTQTSTFAQITAE